MTEEIIDLESLEAQMKLVNAQIEALRTQNIETSKKVFHASIASFFKAFPEVAAIRWRQYTPYFNDGDVCEFSVHEPAVFSKKDFEEGVDDDYEYNSWRGPSSWTYKYVAENIDRYGDLEVYKQQIADYELMKAELGSRYEEIVRGIKKFLNVFNSIEDDTMLSLFGDHVEITVTPDGIEIDEYSHE